jgi:nucleoside-diphosphate-sugar epimerase
MKTLVVGCGYVGLPLARREQAAGHEIGAWVHSRASAEALRPHGFARVIAGSVAEEKLWDEAGAWDQVVLCASSGRGGPDAYREVFLEGARMICRRQPGARRIFVSSTSVYGQTRGEPVTEDSTAEPATETGKILRQAEQVALAAGSIVVRSSGIYGPGRAMLLEKFRRGDAVIEGDGTRWINQIQRDDLAAALAFLLERGEPGQIYNASDDTPVMLLDFYRWCAESSGRPLPPFGPADPNRKRGLTNKRVSNARLRALDWRPVYPGFREGLKNLDRET